MVKMYQYKNTLEVIQKNKRRIFAYIKQNQIRRIKVIIMLALILSCNISSIFAIENSNVSYGEYQILCFKDPNMYIKYSGRPQPNYEYYYNNKNGDQIPAYCLNLGMKGAEEYEEGYTVFSGSQITDNKLKNIILNSYSYKTIEELGLNNKDEAMFATQFAIWCYTENLNLDLIEPINSSNMNVVNAIKNMFNSKDNDLSEKDINIDFKESLQQTEKIDNKLYYYKMLEFNNKNINHFNLTSPDKNIIIKKEQNNKYKVYVPIEDVNKNYKAKLYVNFNAKENIALLGISRLDGFQDVAITLKNNFDYTLLKEIEFKNVKSTVTILKKDKDTNEKLQGIKYELRFEDGKLFGEFITDENGKINFNVYNVDDLNLYLKEIEAKDGYNLDDTTYNIKVIPNKENFIELYNEKQKGTIEIIKKSKEYNKLTNLPENSPLKNVEFQILDKDENVVDTLITNEFGYAKSKKLPIGKYYIKEIKTIEYYEINKELIEVEILKDGDNISTQILNDNVFIEEKLPVTGK